MFEKEEDALKLGPHRGEVLMDYYESLNSARYAYKVQRDLGGVEVSPETPSVSGDLSL